MTQTHNFDEMVDLIATIRTARGPDGVNTSGKVATLPLREAVRTVVEDWDGDKRRQFSAFIVKQSGQPISSFEEIKSLHDQLEGKG